MHPQIKIKLIYLYLRYKFGGAYNQSWLANEQDHVLIDEAIERIHDWGPEFLNLEQIEPTTPELRVFLAILDKALRFSKKIPPVCTHYDESKLDEHMELEDKLWHGLPNANYSQRVVDFPIDVDAEFQQLKEDGLGKLLNLVRKQMPSLKLVSLSDLAQAIQEHENQLKKGKDPVIQKKLRAELNLLIDLNKIVRLRFSDQTTGTKRNPF